ncbi:MAG: transporter [Alphaproteobacteria bacterium]|nr:transporter [Alphaproteobacteria bacterium]MBV9540734.1 transporter [Alphaproteobacteria bacterium]
MKFAWTALFAVLIATPVYAGPPYVTDDPEPTPEGGFEVYGFAGGTVTQDGSGGAAGIDFNYGGAKDLQLTFVLPLAFDRPRGGPNVTGFGEIELAAKYKFLHQDDFGVDVAFFPRLFLPTASDPALGDNHPALFLPLFVEKDFGDWSVFGGGGCTINRGSASHDFCEGGIVLTRRVLPDLSLGVELFHDTGAEMGSVHSTGLGFGAIYDLSETWHLMASGGPGLQHAAETNKYTWFVALLLTR